ncbi:hypothetical protein [Pantoea agglomerans]|jgi:hypothetical protein|uniref:hypothetical protein n=1 Tax=Enterobacter agglomerans TaxID=549 RepID=UPI003C7D80E5
MGEKLTRLPHWLSGFQLLLAALWQNLHGLSLYEWVLVMSLIISPLAFIASITFQWLQTRAIIRAAREGKAIVKPRGLFR